MSVIWPTGLPSLEIVGRFTLSEADNAIRTTMGIGPAKVRRRTTMAPLPVQMGHPALTAAQAALLSAFYVDTLGSGAVAFTMSDPRPGATGDATFRFVQPPQFRPSAPDVWGVTCSLELIP